MHAYIAPKYINLINCYLFCAFAYFRIIFRSTSDQFKKKIIPLVNIYNNLQLLYSMHT